MIIKRALALKKAWTLTGEASHWSNLRNLVKPTLEWADEYFAASVSESNLDRVRRYIKNQEEHHRKKTFAEGCEEFMKKYGFNRVQG